MQDLAGSTNNLFTSSDVGQLSVSPSYKSNTALTMSNPYGKFQNCKNQELTAHYSKWMSHLKMEEEM